MSDATVLVERIFNATVGLVDLATMHVGDRLGLYASLRDDGPGTAGQLAARTGLDERYLREWLEQQATTGVLELDGLRRFVLPAGHAEALVDRDSPLYIAALGRQVIGMLTALPKVLEAFRTGEGVSFSDYGVDTREGIGAQNRAMFVNDLASWLHAVPGLDERLRSPEACVADLGCGEGWSTIAIATAYPQVSVEGYDLDAASIEAARRHAEEAGVADRVTFECRDVTAGVDRQGYELVTIFEALHDMARPVEALHGVRRILTRGGALVVAEERVADRFAPPGDAVERLMHGISVLHCLPASRHDPDSVATGTMLREPLLRSFADDAGYSSVDVLPIDNDFWRFYWLVP